MASKISLVAGILHLLMTLFYVFVGFRLSSLYTDVNIARPNPVLNNWPLIMFAVFTILDFCFFLFLRNKEKQQVRVKYGWLISLVLLLLPFLIFISVGVYANIQMSKALQSIY